MSRSNDDEEQATAAPAERIVCPFCGSAETELISPFGSQLLTSQHRCLTCRTYFEAIRDSFEDDATPR